MASRAGEVAKAGSPADASIFSLPAAHAAERDLIEERPLGIQYGTPAARRKNAEHIFYLFAKNIPALAAIYFIATQPTGWVEWSAFTAFYVMNILSMSIGYHRFFTHKAFETSTPMRYAIAILAQLGSFGSLRRWIAEHRRHHSHSDRAGDIHSPYYDDHGRMTGGFKGWKYSHLGWVFVDSMTDEAVYGKGVAEDKAVLFVDRYRIPIFLISVIVLPTLWALAAGRPDAVLGTVLIAGFLRGVLALHAIACVNSSLNTVSNVRASLGIQERRLNHIIDDLNAQDINISAAKSRIMDADMASEISEFTRLQILQQTGTAILAQANAQPQSILQLLQ